MNAPVTPVERIRGGDRRALARAITAVENATQEGAAIRAGLAPYLGRAQVTGVTGPPGAGKSTLVNALVKELVARGRKVAVIAVDPSSPVSGGAVLGDRVRMAEMQGHEAVFIRSLAARGHLGGLSRTAAQVVELLDGAGFDDVLVETVGAGQSEVEIAKVAAHRLVVCPPGLGDDVQAIKAGILEIADAFVVNKADLPDATRTERELRAMLALRQNAAPEALPPVLKTVATTGEGVAALADWLAARALQNGRPAPDVPHTAPPASGPAALLARLLARDAYARHLGLELVEAGEGTATVSMRVRPEHINFWDSCHGGAIFSLADTALGLACNSYGSVAALIDSHMTFSVAVKAGERLTARAEEISRSRKLGVYRMEVRRDDGVLVASLTGTVYRTGKPLPGEASTGQPA
ncbi:MAG: methylmalonyl Co-A mutase-associated GTPase MeaB [Burkholderiales bacterium]